MLSGCGDQGWSAQQRESYLENCHKVSSVPTCRCFADVYEKHLDWESFQRQRDRLPTRVINDRQDCPQTID